MPENKRDDLIRSISTEEMQTQREYSNEDDNLVVRNIFEIKDLISYEILKQELINSLEQDAYPTFLHPDSNNVIRILSENIDNLEIQDVEDKTYIDVLKTEIRTILLEYLERTYDLKYTINELEPFIDLEPIADLYEFFVIRKLNNIFKYYYSIINMSFFNKIVKEEEQAELKDGLRQYLISLSDSFKNDEPIDDQILTMEMLSKFFGNKEKIVNNGISNIVGFSSFLNFLIEENDGEIVSDKIKEMFYNFGGYEGLDFDDEETFKKYFECISELDNANQLVVTLSSRVFTE